MMEKRLEDMVVTVVGAGQIGGSLVLALKKSQSVKTLIGVDREEVLQKHEFGSGFDSMTPDIRGAASRADFVFLSTPVLTILRLLPEIASWMKPDAVLLDSGSTKKAIVEMMGKFPSSALVGGHPMAGREKAGFDAADPSLFENKLFALTFPTAESLKGKKVVFQIVHLLGAVPFEVDAEAHDRYVSLTSHLPYALSLALSSLAADCVGKDPLFERFIASGFQSATRLSLTHSEMGKGMLVSNSSHIIQMIDGFISQLEVLRELVDGRNPGAIESYLGKIRHFRAREGGSRP